MEIKYGTIFEASYQLIRKINSSIILEACQGSISCQSLGKFFLFTVLKL